MERSCALLRAQLASDVLSKLLCVVKTIQFIQSFCSYCEGCSLVFYEQLHANILKSGNGACPWWVGTARPRSSWLANARATGSTRSTYPYWSAIPRGASDSTSCCIVVRTGTYVHSRTQNVAATAAAFFTWLSLPTGELACTYVGTRGRRQSRAGTRG